MAVASFATSLFVMAAATPSLAQDYRVLPSGRYVIDDSHSVVIWRVQQLGLSWYPGLIETVTGAVDYDATDPSASSAVIDMHISSATTDYRGDSGFGAEVLAYLKAEEHPLATFRSTAFTLVDPTQGALVGDLTLGGVTKQVALSVELTGVREAHPFSGTPAFAINATATIRRSDFAIATPGSYGDYLDSLLSDDVRIIVSAELILEGQPSTAPSQR